MAHEFVRRLIGLLIEDVIAETTRRLAKLNPHSTDEVRSARQPLSPLSLRQSASAEALIKDFLKEHMYRHERIKRVMNEAERVVRDLFARYSTDPGDLPPEWGEGLAQLATKNARGTLPISLPA